VTTEAGKLQERMHETFDFQRNLEFHCFGMPFFLLLFRLVSYTKRKSSRRVWLKWVAFKKQEKHGKDIEKNNAQTCTKSDTFAKRKKHYGRPYDVYQI
jgi:hypothetical protein